MHGQRRSRPSGRVEIDAAAARGVVNGGWVGEQVERDADTIVARPTSSAPGATFTVRGRRNVVRGRISEGGRRLCHR
jgi:hypothetical protein